jgi:hypothetical protein
MPILVGFGTFAALPEEQISEKVSRRILSGDHGMIVWSEHRGWRPRRAAQSRKRADRMDVQGQDGVPPRQRAAGLRRRRRRGYSGRYRARRVVPRRHRGDRFLRTSARGLFTRRQTCLHKRRLNRPIAAKSSAAMQSSEGGSQSRCADPVARLEPRAVASFPDVMGAAVGRASSDRTSIAVADTLRTQCFLRNAVPT